MKNNIKVSNEVIERRHAIAKALTDCKNEASTSENNELASKIQFETTKFLGGRQNLFTLTDPDSLFLL